MRPEEIRTGMNVLFAFVRSSLEGGRRLGLPEVEADFTITGRSGALVA